MGYNHITVMSWAFTRPVLEHLPRSNVVVISTVMAVTLAIMTTVIMWSKMVMFKVCECVQLLYLSRGVSDLLTPLPCFPVGCSESSDGLLMRSPWPHFLSGFSQPSVLEGSGSHRANGPLGTHGLLRAHLHSVPQAPATFTPPQAGC